MSTRPTADRKYRLESFLAMDPTPEPTTLPTDTTPGGPLNPTKSATSPSTTTPPKPFNPTKPLSPTESSKEEKQTDSEYKPPVTFLYVICWLLLLPVAMCVGFITSPRHKKAKKTADGPPDLEKQDAGMERQGKASLNLEPVALRGDVRLDALPEAEEGRHIGSKEVAELSKN